MKSYKYLIIGNGMTANAAVRGIRELDAEGSIGVIGVESDQPYKRPPLSKGLWKGLPFEKIWLNTQNYNVEFHLGRKAALLHGLQGRIGLDAPCLAGGIHLLDQGPLGLIWLAFTHGRPQALNLRAPLGEVVQVNRGGVVVNTRQLAGGVVLEHQQHFHAVARGLIGHLCQLIGLAHAIAVHLVQAVGRAAQTQPCQQRQGAK